MIFGYIFEKGLVFELTSYVLCRIIIFVVKKITRENRDRSKASKSLIGTTDGIDSGV